MFNDRSSSNQEEHHTSSGRFHDIHPLTPPQPSSLSRAPRRETYTEADPEASHENYSVAMSRESERLSMIQNDGSEGARVEDEQLDQMNALAIVPENSTTVQDPVASSPAREDSAAEEVSLHRVRKEEVESKISAWQTAKISKVNNRFKREDVIINGWEDEHLEKASCWLKKVERNLDEQRARAVEKMQNDVAKARRKVEEKRASAEAKRGAKVARILEVAKLMRAIGRAPPRRSFF